MHLRPVRDDEPGMRTFFDELSRDSLCFRFFGLANLEWASKWSVDVDYADRQALVATAGQDHAIVAHGIYIRIDAARAEVAFVVADAWQGHGIATIMLAHLAAAAHRRGHRGLHGLRAAGQPSDDRGVPRQRLPRRTCGPRMARSKSSFRRRSPLRRGRRFEERDRTAAVAAVRSFLRPQSVAVIGASRRRETVGGEILAQPRSAAASPARSTPSTRRRSTIQGLAAYASVADIPEPVELAVIAVPAGQRGRGRAGHAERRGARLS